MEPHKARRATPNLPRYLYPRLATDRSFTSAASTDTHASPINTHATRPVHQKKASIIIATQSRSRQFGQDDKWNFCLTTAIIAVNRRNHEQTTPPEPLTGLQGEGGPGRRQGRPHNRPAGGAFRRSPQSDHGMEIAA